MDLQLTRVCINPDISYISNITSHQMLYYMLIIGIDQRYRIYKLRNNYHLGIL